MVSLTLQEIEVIGLLTAIAAFWSSITAAFDWPRRLLVIRRECDSDAGKALLSYLVATATSKPCDGAVYRGDRVPVRTLGRVVLVFAESLHFGPQVFWLRGRPIWYTYDCGDASKQSKILFSYFRFGGVDWEALLRDVATWDDDQYQTMTGQRYHVHYHGNALGSTSTDTLDTLSTGFQSALETLSRPGNGVRLLHWQPENLGYGQPITLDMMSLASETNALVTDVARFLNSREWYAERGIPWRRGWLLAGKPGTGKTTIVRGLAIEHDLPVHTFDLAALDNHGLKKAWDQMLRDVPCVALIEDIDAVYKGRANVTEGIGPTFDLLLQCVGGVTTCDGVCLFVSSNKPKLIDAALRRGGRLDMCVEFKNLNHEGRLKMARRILGNEAEARGVADAPNMVTLSPADFQERLSRMALAQRFGDLA